MVSLFFMADTIYNSKLHFEIGKLRRDLVSHVAIIAEVDIFMKVDMSMKVDMLA